MAFELLSADLRAAGGFPCPLALPGGLPALSTGSGRWWETVPAGGLRAYAGTQPFPDAGFGTGSSQRLRGTEAIEIHQAGAGARGLVAHDPEDGLLQLPDAGHGVVAGDLVLGCDATRLLVGQAAGSNGARIRLQPLLAVHPCGEGQEVAGCAAAAGPLRPGEALVAPVRAVRWFLARNPAGVSSLYRQQVENGVVTAYEMVEGVQGLQFGYLAAGSGGFLDAAAMVPPLPAVRAVRVRLVVQGVETGGENGVATGRPVEFIVALRQGVE